MCATGLAFMEFRKHTRESQLNLDGFEDIREFFPGVGSAAVNKYLRICCFGWPWDLTSLLAPLQATEFVPILYCDLCMIDWHATSETLTNPSFLCAQQPTPAIVRAPVKATSDNAAQYFPTF